MTFVARLGLAITSPRWALTAAADRRHAGRSGTDLIIAIAIVLLATQLRGIVGAVWLGAVTAPGLGVRLLLHVLTQALVVKLGFLVIAAVVLWGLSGRRRNLGRAFDLACVAALPLVYLDLAATVVVRIAGLDVPREVGFVLIAASFAWAGVIVALGWRPARLAPRVVPPPPEPEIVRARRAGWAVLALAVIGTLVQGIWIARNLDLLRPMTEGDPAPGFALPTVGAHGERGPALSLSSTRGKVTVLDFWATWCQPCLNAMPRLDAIAKTHPEIAVIAINIDNPSKARALFTERGYGLTLVFDDDNVRDRYGVDVIPHTVVIDQAGLVRMVERGGGSSVEATIDRLLREQIRK